MKIILKGGPGSGFHGHKGRPGEVGGSSSGSFGRGSAQGQASNVVEAFTNSNRIRSHFNEDLGDYTLEAMEDGKLQSWDNASDKLRSLVKRTIVATLQQKGVDKNVASEILSQWAASSNDNNLTSLSLQQAVSEEFDVPLSDWQSRQIDIVQSKYGDFYRNGTAGTDEDYRNAARVIYENTQQELAQAGYKPTDTIRLYRGMVYHKDIDVDPQLEKGATYGWNGNAVESWSFDKNIADSFAGTNAKSVSWMTPNKKRYVVSMDVPISSIFSTAKTGIGCLTEAEVIVFGSIGHEIYVEDVV